jgi:uncharacterized protein (TIGR03067 family)
VKHGLVTIFLFIAILVIPACKGDLRTSELKNLQGKWHLVKEVHQGVETPAEEIKNGFIIFDAENNWRVEVDGEKVGGGSFKIDPDKSPKTIDYTFAEGEEKGKTFSAIYELGGGSFKHCGVMDGERPKSFSAGEDSENYLVIFEREK